MSDETRPSWVSAAAVAWVIDDAPVPIELAWTLVVIARRCNEQGRGSWQSIPTIAAKTGKSAKQARRDVQRLLDLGLIQLGDQTMVEHLPIGQRSVVYDLNLSARGAKPARKSRNPTGLKSGQTPPMDGSTPLDGSPGMDGTPTSPMDGSGTPPLDGSQRDPLKNHVEEPSLSPRDPDTSPVGAAPNRERDQRKPKIQTPTALVTPHLTDPANAEAVIEHIITTRKVNNPEAFFIHADGNGTLPGLVRAAEQAGADFHDKDARHRFRQEIGWEPKCEHGEPGGHIQQPGTGWVVCPVERLRLRKAAEQRPTNGMRGHNSRDGTVDWDNLTDADLSFNPNR